MLRSNVLKMGLAAVSSLVLGAAADTAFIDFELGVVFPKKLAEMEYDRFQKYNNEDFGYSIFYKRGDAFSCEVSVLTMGRTAIPDGYKGDGVEMIFKAVDIEMERRAKEGEILKVQKRGGTVVPKKSPLQFQNRVFQYSEPREGAAQPVPRMNSVYVTGSHNKFIKVQFNFDVAGNKAARAMADRLVKELVVALITEHSEEDILMAACDAAINFPADYGGQLAAQHVFQKFQTMENLNIYDAFFVWPDGYRKPKNADFLTTAYFAGMLKTVVPQDLDQGGEVEAFEAMIEAYENMRARDQIEAISELEKWSKHPDKKELYKNLLVEFGYEPGG